MTAGRKWSSQGSKTNAVAADYFLLSDSADTNPITKQKQYTFSSLLADIGKINNVTGFSFSGGSTTTRAITVSANSTIDQDLAGSASVTWNNVSATTRVRGNGGWLAGVFGSNVTTPVVVMGNLNGAASLGAHNNALSAWAALYIQPENDAFTGFGLSVIGGQTPNATIHGGGSTILGVATSAVADANIYNSQMNIWYDQSNSRLIFKAKSSGSTVTSFPLTATGGLDQLTSRTSQTVDVNSASDDIVGLDSTPGANLFNIDPTGLNRPLRLAWVKGASQPQFQPSSGNTIEGSSSTKTFTALYSSITIIKDPALSTNMIITASRGSFT